MREKLEKKDLLNRFLETALDSWDIEELEQIRPTIVRTAKAVEVVEQFQLRSEEEPMVSITHFHQRDTPRESNQE